MKNEVETVHPENKASWMIVMMGWGISYAITLCLLLLFAVVLTYTSLSEQSIEPVILVITVISILIGSSIASRCIKKQGMIHRSYCRNSLYGNLIFHFEFYENRIFCKCLLCSHDGIMCGFRNVSEELWE